MNSKKTGITVYTLNGFVNYGNRLQLFALCEVLRRYGNTINIYWPLGLKRKIQIILKTTIPIMKKYQTEKKLRNFTKKNITNSSYSKRASIGIFGSDQVWNPDYLKKNDYLLAESSLNRNIAYAASVGKTELDDAQKDLFRKRLENYSAISVRERSAKELLQPLTDKKIEVVLDPTLLLSQSVYASLEKKPKEVFENERYVLCYILGNRNHEAAIERFAKEKGYRTIYFSDKRDSNYGVEEFLYLIHHARLVCTDSFHACVFSLIFERPFVAFKRTGKENYMYTRLQNLIETFNLKNREFNGKEITKENLDADFSEAKKILKKEQEKSLNFLKKALDIKE